MKLWHRPARQLPTTVAPLQSEIVGSYVRRLAEANELWPTTIERALGVIRHGGSGNHLLVKDAVLNDLALSRLETYSGIPADHLVRAMPALRDARRSLLPTEPPMTWWFTTHSSTPCWRCAAPKGAATALVRFAPMICTRHRRLARDRQCDLSHAPEILSAWRRYTKLSASSEDSQWLHATAYSAWNITLGWSYMSAHRHGDLLERWTIRAQALGHGYEGGSFRSAIVLPEAMILAGILADLDWRRHLALVPNWKLGGFYDHVSRSTGADKATMAYHKDDPLRHWVLIHRERFRRLREDQHAYEHSSKWWEKPPPPEKSHFK